MILIENIFHIDCQLRCTKCVRIFCFVVTVQRLITVTGGIGKDSSFKLFDCIARIFDIRASIRTHFISNSTALRKIMREGKEIKRNLKYNQRIRLAELVTELLSIFSQRPKCKHIQRIRI